MTPEEAIAVLENKRQKVIKRAHKEEKDILRLHEDLMAITQNKLLQQHQVEQILSSSSSSASTPLPSSPLMTPHTEEQTSPDHSSENTEVTADKLPVYSPSSPSAPNLLNQLPLDASYMISNLEKKEKAIRSEIESLLLKLSRIKGEEEELLSFFTLTIQQRYQLNDWMGGIQCLLWPKSPEEEDAGRPLLSGFPNGLLNSVEYANKLGLEKVHDVKVIIDGFRWMTWCYQCLIVLRLPPTSRQLKQLIDSAATCKLADEKIVKILSGISLRAS
jgi:hypothetical protein